MPAVLPYGLIYQDNSNVTKNLGILGGHVPMVCLNVPLLMLYQLSRQTDQKVLKVSVFELKQ